MQKLSTLAMIVVAAACGHSSSNKQPTAESRPPEETQPAPAMEPEKEVQPVAGAETPTAEPTPVPPPAPRIFHAGSEVSIKKGMGKVTIDQTDDVTNLKMDFTAMKPGMYSIALHEKGDCGGKKFMNAGERWGGEDLGTVEIAKDGTGSFEKELTGMSIEPGEKSLSDRAIIVYDVPKGKAAPKAMGCGVIKTI